MALQSGRSPREWVEAFGYVCSGCGYDRWGEPRRWRQYKICLGCVLAIRDETPLRYESEAARHYSLSDGERRDLRTQLRRESESEMSVTVMEQTQEGQAQGTEAQEEAPMPKSTKHAVSKGEMLPVILNANADMVAAGVEFTSTGLTLPRGLPHRHWEELGKVFPQMDDAARWALGDWLVYGETEYGSKYAKAAKATGYEESTLEQIAFVARAFDQLRRRNFVRWWVHRELASKPHEIQDAWLNMAEKRGPKDPLRRDELRMSLAPRDKVPTLDDLAAASGEGEEDTEAQAATLPQSDSQSEGDAAEVDATLLSSLHGYTDSGKTWERLRIEGISNVDLRRQIAVEYGEFSGSGSKGRDAHCGKGGALPRFWHGSGSPIGEPTLQGMALVDAARRVLGLPFPGAQGIDAPSEALTTFMEEEEDAEVETEPTGMAQAVSSEAISQADDDARIHGSPQVAFDPAAPGVTRVPIDGELMSVLRRCQSDGKLSYGRIEPPVLIGTKLWTVLRVRRNLDTGAEEADAVRVWELDAFIDHASAQGVTKQVVQLSRWQQEVSAQTRKQGDFTSLRVTADGPDIFVIGDEHICYVCLPAQGQGMRKPAAPAAPEEPMTALPTALDSIAGKVPQYPASFAWEDLTPDEMQAGAAVMRLAIEEIDRNLADVFADYPGLLESLLDDDAEEALSENRQTLTGFLNFWKPVLHTMARGASLVTGLDAIMLAGSDMHLLQALAARPRPGQTERYSAADCLHDLLEKTAAQAGLELEASV